ncbi:MAG: hypothetical protein ABIS86_23460 [Streptosporangiaceae bacterium]
MSTSRLRRICHLGVPATLVAALIVAQPAGAAAKRSQLAAESFTGPTVSSTTWSSANTRGTHVPCLTSATTNAAGSLPACRSVLTGATRADAPGNGVFQLTDSSEQTAGVLVLNNPVNAKAGLHVAFDMFMYNAVRHNNRGGDGIALYLINGAQGVVQSGDPGAALGYKGVPGAFAGVGFDHYGNYSNPYYYPGHQSPGVRPNSVVVRGAQSTGYQYLTGKTAPGSLSVDAATSRSQSKRTVNVDVSTEGIMNVYINFYDGRGMQKIISAFDLDNIPHQPALPPTIKLGIAASTGTARAFHSISNFSVSQLDPDLNLKLAAGGSIAAGGQGSFTATVAASASEGPTNGQVTSTFQVPAGLTPGTVTGLGWNCSVNGRQVTCGRSGTGTDSLRPGSSYPPIRVNLTSSNPAPSQVILTGDVAVPNERMPADNSASLTVPIAPGPDLSVVLTASGPTISGVVSNAANAGPTYQPTTLTIPIPNGTSVKAVVPGSGWTCTTGASAVVCTRPDVLQPGSSFTSSFTPVKVTLDTLSGNPMTVLATAVVKTPGDPYPANDTAVPILVTIPARPPNLSVVLSTDGPFLAGQPVTYLVKVSNSASAGPTNGTVSVTQNIPAGMSYVTAFGNFWSCSQSNQQVTCTRPGNGSDALAPGASYPAITIRVQAPPVTVTATATVSTPTEVSTGDNSASLTGTIGYGLLQR